MEAGEAISLAQKSMSNNIFVILEKLSVLLYYKGREEFSINLVSFCKKSQSTMFAANKGGTKVRIVFVQHIRQDKSGILPCQ